MRQYLERDQSLVVIHGKNAVVRSIRTKGEEPVGRERPLCVYAVLTCSINGRTDDRSFFRTNTSMLSCMRIQSKHSNARRCNAMVNMQCAMQGNERCNESVDRQCIGHVSERKVNGGKGNTHRIGTQHHQRRAATHGREHFGLSRVRPSCKCIRFLAYRESYQSIEVTRS